jgi:uncharacterized protein YfaS (alpha-2-macroglobulin family)
MLGKRGIAVLTAAAVICSAAGVWIVAADRASHKTRRANLEKSFKAGNYRDAYDGLRKLALDPKNDPADVGKDLQLGIRALQHLGRSDEIDGFMESVIAVHKKNWRLLQSAAQSYGSIEHYGYIVAGKFSRGWRKGGGRFVSSAQRDRGRALQLMQDALKLTGKEKDKPALADFHLAFANLLLSGAGYHEAWRLQYLTDLSKLPDYDETRYYWYRGENRGAPVDVNGQPIYYGIPKSYEAAVNDGERWRWMLSQAVEFAPGRASEIDMVLAHFMRGQLGVQTMAWYGSNQGAKTGTFALHTLGDNETIARLATGVARIQLPDEFNWIKICERVARRGKSKYGSQARDLLAGEYEDRRQYVKAATAWRTAIKEYGRGHKAFRQKRLDQIVDNWGRFEPNQTQPAGRKASVDFRFRNGKKVSFEAYPIRVTKLLDDVKAYLKSNPGRLDWNKLQISNLGFRLVDLNERQYIGARVASWDVKLKPRPGHIDDRITIDTPLQKPGAYLLKGRMVGGNVSRIIVWVADTILVKKMLDGQVYYFAADAVTGQPVPKAKLDFFGYKQEWINPPRPGWRVDTTSFKQTADADGQVIVTQKSQPHNYSWLITARKKGDGFGGADRLAYMGFTGVWYGSKYDPEYNQTRVFAMTDRPVYRPEHKVQWKTWVRHAKYDQADTSSFAGKSFTVRIRNPRGEKIFDKNMTADNYGGLSGELPLARGCMLGGYYLTVGEGEKVFGGGPFRVEEYKKPEFEVKVEAPKEPVRLGEKVTATIKAKYYFGAPVTQARVKYKVLRTGYSASWYPAGQWDWFYGAGYWWFASDYAWYPGWAQWGCARPVVRWWGGGWRNEQPEVVMENEVPVGQDGTVKISIDTAPAKALHGDMDHQYSITAEVVDDSRRTIVGTGNVLVSRKPFKVYTWVDRGYFRVGDTINAHFSAQTLARKPVEGKGELTLYRISYKKNRPVEKAVQTWKLDTSAQGRAHQKMKAARTGQYRLSYKVTDSKKHTIEGGYVFVVRGPGFKGKDFRFNDLELVTDKREYAPGEKVKLMVNTNRNNGVVLLFARPSGVYLRPKVLRLGGKSALEQIAVVQRDMPNFYVEALTVADGRVHTEIREVVVPPAKRILNVEVLPSQAEYRPGQKAKVKVKLTDLQGRPFVGSTVLSVYDKSVEYISGGSNVPEIKEFFWKWRRHHWPSTETSLANYLYNLTRRGETPMGDLGVFGASVVEEMQRKAGAGKGFGAGDGPAAPGALGGGRGLRQARDGADKKEAKGKNAEQAKPAEPLADRDEAEGGQRPGQGGPEPTVRKNFADTAYWTAALMTNKKGIAEVAFTMPENLTGWKVKVWAMGHGTKVGQGEAEVVTKKDLLIRMQAPRFFTQKDEVVLSANVHNYLKKTKVVKVSLELEGGTLVLKNGSLVKSIRVPAGSDKRVDWRVSVKDEGQAVVRMKAVTDEESDAMQMRFPCYVHGMLKMDSFSGVIRPEKTSGKLTMTVPSERRVEQSRLEVRYSPTLAGAMVDALPYLVEYPYGCTEQTLNRFLPTVITQRVLQRMKLDLKDIEKKRTNLNAAELGDDKERAKGWKRYKRNPVFDVDEVRKMAGAGVNALVAMQLGDGGWGWFSGYGERSWPHTTAVVVHGLQIAKENDVAIPQNVIERGVAWLKNYQAEQLRLIKNGATKTIPYKLHADNLDALVYMVLVDAKVANNEMRDYLYRDRTKLAVYAKAMYGLALHKQNEAAKLKMILKNIDQYLEEDKENQTAYLRLPAGNPWWFWYGSEVEANGYYLKLLAKTSPKGKKTAGLVKYLLNNRKHATYWANTRDTAVCIEAMADYLKASGEDSPNLTVEVWVDGKKHKEVKIDKSNLFSFDNKLVLTGPEVKAGKRTVEIRKKGTGPVYFNAYLTNFTLEDHITKAGLEVKVNRKYYKLTRVAKKIKVRGARGQVVERSVEKYKRTELANLATLKSGDLVEIELEIDSKNDYEYLCFEDPKAAGFEPMLVRSGYNPNDMGAYMELRDERVCFFVRWLARGKHSMRYRMRAEIPGKYSALPTRAYAMYAPELKGNSDEIKLAIED